MRERSAPIPIGDTSSRFPIVLLSVNLMALASDGDIFEKNCFRKALLRTLERAACNLLQSAWGAKDGAERVLFTHQEGLAHQAM